MKTHTFIAAIVGAIALGGAAQAAGFDESVCVAQAGDEGWANGEALCRCLAEAADGDAALSKELGELQRGSASDRTPENFTPAIANAVKNCSV
ncbi:MAG: hypothetical protein AB7F91_07985 [Parvularculaceae bacterium]